MKSVALNFPSIKVDFKPTINKGQSIKLALGHLVLRPSHWSSSIKVHKPFFLKDEVSLGDLDPKKYKKVIAVLQMNWVIFFPHLLVQLFYS